MRRLEILLVSAILLSSSPALALDDSQPHPWPLFQRAAPSRHNVVSLGLGGGATCCDEGVHGVFPAVSFSFARNITDRFAIEASLGTSTLHERRAIDDVEIAGLFFMRSATRVKTLLPFVRVGFGAASDDFTELATYLKLRAGVGAEYQFAPFTVNIPGIARAGTTWGVRVETALDVLDAGVIDWRQEGQMGSVLRTSISLIHRF